MTPSSVIWALLTIALALWSLPVERVEPAYSPPRLTALAAVAMTVLYCALIAGVLAG